MTRLARQAYKSWQFVGRVEEDEDEEDPAERVAARMGLLAHTHGADPKPPTASSSEGRRPPDELPTT